ncbi:hypothetical protein V8F20_002948 [Naviculisporaceae sp. PSN 640]
MHLPRTVITIALAASTATALPGWMGKGNKEEFECENGACSHGNNLEKGQGQVKELLQCESGSCTHGSNYQTGNKGQLKGLSQQQHQHEQRSERGGGASRGQLQDIESVKPLANGLWTKDGDDFLQRGNKLNQAGDDFYLRGYQRGNKLNQDGNDFLQRGNKLNQAGDDFYQRGYQRGNKLNQYLKGDQVSNQHLVTRHIESNEQGSGSKLLTYVKGGVVAPRNYHLMGKLHYNEAASGNDHEHLWTRHVENVVDGLDKFVQAKPIEGGGEEFDRRRDTKTDNFFDIKKNQGGDDFYQLKGGDDFAQIHRGGEIDYNLGGQRAAAAILEKETNWPRKEPRDLKLNGGDDFAQIHGGDEINYALGGQRGDIFEETNWPRKEPRDLKALGGGEKTDYILGGGEKTDYILGSDEQDYALGGQRGGILEETNWPRKEPRDLKLNGGQWKESSNQGCFELAQGNGGYVLFSLSSPFRRDLQLLIRIALKTLAS